MPQHVVIVDDQHLNLKLFARIAGEVGDVAVHAFRSSREALDWCQGNEVDCFIFDYHMPAPDGLQMIAHARAPPTRSRMVPIVIVTGEHEREVRYQAFDAGANDFLQKPVDYREFVARLTTLLALRAAQKRLAMQIGRSRRSLLDSEERSRHHAERLEALWRIANNPTLQDEELVYAMLEQGAAAIRPGQPFLGLLGRIEGADLITEAMAGDGGELSRKFLRVGNRTQVERTRRHPLARSGRHAVVGRLGSARGAEQAARARLARGDHDPLHRRRLDLRADVRVGRDDVQAVRPARPRLRRGAGLVLLRRTSSSNGKRCASATSSNTTR